jgi:hypothetical protein
MVDRFMDCIVDMQNHFRGFHYMFHYVELFRNCLECITSFKSVIIGNKSLSLSRHVDNSF